MAACVPITHIQTTKKEKQTMREPWEVIWIILQSLCIVVHKDLLVKVKEKKCHKKKKSSSKGKAENPKSKSEELEHEFTEWKESTKSSIVWVSFDEEELCISFKYGKSDFMLRCPDPNASIRSYYLTDASGSRVYFLLWRKRGCVGERR